MTHVSLSSHEVSGLRHQLHAGRQPGYNSLLPIVSGPLSVSSCGFLKGQELQPTLKNPKDSSIITARTSAKVSRMIYLPRSLGIRHAEFPRRNTAPFGEVKGCSEVQLDVGRAWVLACLVKESCQVVGFGQFGLQGDLAITAF